MSCPNVKECICPKITCPNHGQCCKCVIKHRNTDSLPYCLFPDNNGDKSNENQLPLWESGRIIGLRRGERSSPLCFSANCAAPEPSEKRAKTGLFKRTIF